MATEPLSHGALPRIQWSPVIAGVLCALAVHIVLGLFGAAFGFAVDAAESTGVGVAAGIWAMLVPLVAFAIGAFVCVRIAREVEPAGTYLHGAMVWCIGLIAGAVFLSTTIASGAMASAIAASGSLRGPAARMGDTGRMSRTEVEDVQKGAAAVAGAGGLGAVLGLAGAFLGAAVARGALRGRGLGARAGGGIMDRVRLGRHDGRAEYERGWRDATAALGDRSGVVTSTTRPPEAQRRSGDVQRPGTSDDPALHH